MFALGEIWGNASQCLVQAGIEQKMQKPFLEPDFNLSQYQFRNYTTNLIYHFKVVLPTHKTCTKCIICTTLMPHLEALRHRREFHLAWIIRIDEI